MSCCGNYKSIIDCRETCYDPTINIVGCTHTDNVGIIPRLGTCSVPNTRGFYKKKASTPNYTISQAYIPDISPMFGGRAIAKEFGLHYQ